ncbi:MAG: PEP-CTERM sorting domain-containing protein [Burkholderiales bacterium]|nr:MAG: PEP-CTERM sorting domain-containing protein [Burkholderiales bacterium]
MTIARPLILLLALLPGLAAAACDRSLQPPPSSGTPQRILFVGNSFLHGHAPPVLHYNAARVTDLNGTQYGGVPGVFKQLADEAGLQVAVSSELLSGQTLHTHLDQKRGVITAQPWDVVVLQEHSLLNPHQPGDAAALVGAASTLESAVHAVNPQARVYLLQTWPRADQVYQTPGGRWAGRSLEAMLDDLRAGYAKAAQQAACVAGVLPVGEAALRAVQEGVADRNPYDGIDAGKVNLWGPDSYHFGPWGSYLEALVIFGRLTGRDPTSLGPQSRAGRDLGLTPAEVEAAQRVASRELQAVKPAASPGVPSRP